MAKRIVLVRHNDDPLDDRVFTHISQRGFTPVVVKPFADEAIVPMDETIAGSIVYGGRFEAYATDRYPFLKEEGRWIEACMKRDVPLLGICQGAQQIAHLLGASVGPPDNGTAEFGYYRIEPTEAGRGVLPEPLYVPQSHYHTFGIPAGATHLASSAMFPNQAFAYGTKTFAFQFHAEVTTTGFRRWQDDPGIRYDRPGAQSRQEQERMMHLHDAAQAKWFHGFLDELFGEPG